MKNQNKAYFFALLTVALWSTMSSAFKLTLGFMSFDNLLFWSVLFACISVGILLILSGRYKLLKQLTRQQLIRSAIYGLLNPFAYYLVLFRAYELLQAQEAGVLNYTWPVVLVILSVIFLKQKISRLSILAILISFMGLLVISTKGDILHMNFQNPYGAFLAVGSSIIWASYWIINLNDKREEISKIFINLFFGFLYISVYKLAFSPIETPPLKGLLGAIYIGVFEMGITFVLWLMALKLSTTTAKVSNLIFLSPFIALFFISIFVGEKIHPTTIFGLILIISGIFLQQFKSKKDRPVNIKTT